MPAVQRFLRRAVFSLLAFAFTHIPCSSHAMPYLGEIRWVAFNFAPQNWALCDGSVLQIVDNEALFNLIGTTYGGDGVTTFALPDMRGRSPIGANALHPLASPAGQEHVTLTSANLPLHTHTVLASNSIGNSASPTNNVWALSQIGNPLYKSSGTSVPLAPGIVGYAGGGQPHTVMQPYTVLNCIISLTGIFPSQN